MDPTTGCILPRRNILYPTGLNKNSPESVRNVSSLQSLSASNATPLSRHRTLLRPSQHRRACHHSSRIGTYGKSGVSHGDTGGPDHAGSQPTGGSHAGDRGSGDSGVSSSCCDRRNDPGVAHHATAGSTHHVDGIGSLQPGQSVCAVFSESAHTLHMSCAPSKQRTPCPPGAMRSEPTVSGVDAGIKNLCVQ